MLLSTIPQGILYEVMDQILTPEQDSCSEDLRASLIVGCLGISLHLVVQTPTCVFLWWMPPRQNDHITGEYFILTLKSELNSHLNCEFCHLSTQSVILHPRNDRSLYHPIHRLLSLQI